MNCYRYSSPMMMGESSLVVDLNFRSTPSYKDNTSLVSGFATLMDSSTKLGITESRVSPHVYRMAIKFVAGKNYKICYVPNSIELVGEEYSVAINLPSMPMIYAHEFASKNTLYSDNY